MTASDERAIENGLYRVAAALDARDRAALGAAVTSTGTRRRR